MQIPFKSRDINIESSMHGRAQEFVPEVSKQGHVTKETTSTV